MTVQNVFLVYPHQLFKDIRPLRKADLIIIIEEQLYFLQYKFHKMKLLHQRASMKYYADMLKSHHLNVRYIDAREAESDSGLLIAKLAKNQVKSITYYDVCDNWLEKRLVENAKKWELIRHENPSPMFLNTKTDLKEYFEGREFFFQTDFYIRQRKKWNILLDNNQKPLGGRWSFDSENRLRYPREKQAPEVIFPLKDRYFTEAASYVMQQFPQNPGLISDTFRYPVTHQESENWLSLFLKARLPEFGPYEDAIVSNENILNHSVLSPLLNNGLLTPDQVIQHTLSHAANHSVPLNSLEGFLRQIIGWREFIRGVYVFRGSKQRTTNFWKFENKLPSTFYSGTTGIEPLDKTIKKVNETAYCHHIERLMVLGNFMLLNEIHPNEVYRWFLEMFIDAWDWVMVPNVYGMSQFADGGLMATKPYISGSNYLMKMSDYKKGDWQLIWDALFWRFLSQQRNFFSKNPRLNMLLNTFDKMQTEKQQMLLRIAENAISASRRQST